MFLAGELLVSVSHKAFAVTKASCSAVAVLGSVGMPQPEHEHLLPQSKMVWSQVSNQFLPWMPEPGVAAGRAARGRSSPVWWPGAPQGNSICSSSPWAGKPSGERFLSTQIRRWTDVLYKVEHQFQESADINREASDVDSIISASVRAGMVEGYTI